MRHIIEIDIKQKQKQIQAKNKKQEKQVMKTNFKSTKRNNVQKTALNVAAIIISLVILSVNVDAQGMWQSFMEMKNAEESEIALANDTRNLSFVNEIGITEANSFASYEEQETEEALDLKDWMTNTSFFTVNTVETENALELEDWMVNEKYFRESAFQFEIETESALELEGWMVNDNYFQATENGDKPLALESWMVAENYWTN